MQQFLEFSPEVQAAIKNQTPILALESTVITHGMPYPQNIETAVMLEAIVREQDVVPATIAIMNGKIKIGLTLDELTRLAQDTGVKKASTRDISYFLHRKMSAGTTVAATLVCAHAAGIKVFATGGIGGVHRGDALDISADLIALARTPMALICAGAKSILDLPRTLEFLETHSVPVIGYGTDYLPAFYSASSAYPLSARVDDVETLAQIFTTHLQLNLESGLLIANPIPASAAIAPEEIEPAIEQALARASQQGVSGKDMTPFLLKEMSQVTRGKSQIANVALIKNNVLLGAMLARQS